MVQVSPAVVEPLERLHDDGTRLLPLVLDEGTAPLLDLLYLPLFLLHQLLQLLREGDSPNGTVLISQERAIPTDKVHCSINTFTLDFSLDSNTFAVLVGILYSAVPCSLQGCYSIPVFAKNMKPVDRQFRDSKSQGQAHIVRSTTYPYDQP